MQEIKYRNRIAILQPEVPHYRTEFFHRIADKVETSDIFIFNSLESARKSGFKVELENLEYIPNWKYGGILLYNPLSILCGKYGTLVLMLHFGHITTWLLLLTKWIHRKKIILWGQGISVKRYLQEEKNPDWKLKLMISLSDGAWIYTHKEAEQWRTVFPNKPIVALGNSLSGVEEVIRLSEELSAYKNEYKQKYGIKEKRILIFCARFESPYRRTDLLLETIERLDSNEYGFIIIGKGKYKPDFSKYSNVYDYGAVYDKLIKQELFTIADLYFQPGWVGLSIVEAMSYGIPVCTFVRSEKTLQCVEYSYLEDGVNAMIFSNMADCYKRITEISDDELLKLGVKAKEYVRKNLTPENMARQALNIINIVS